ncbi:MAG TPA: acyclic terpene utilization AtuA family protein [Nocardioidaceae bacterium]|nr:acyclic terpene utilization AtuA family protein [Nocardioidaceae bacterium]
MHEGVLRVANCSGFYGDRLAAMREMLEGGPVDVLTGDYLAELTLLILGRDRMKDPTAGYARTFVRQVEDCLGQALERGVRIVSNAGGLNPAGLAARLREVAGALGLSPTVAHVHGDDLLPRAAALGFTEGGDPLTANAYLGGFGIAAALQEGADVVVTGRVTDASLVVGPAVAHFGWTHEDRDALAGAVAAGHVIECGAQATGGNFSGFDALPREAPLGFPLAEIGSDGSSVITKHPGTGGAVTRDTVTAQLVYEIGDPRYLGPDVTLRLDSLCLTDDGPDRVKISGARGEPPPRRLKVCRNQLGGFRNSVEMVLTGLDIEAKAAWVRDQVEAALADRRPAEVEWTLARTDHADADTEEAASCLLRVTVRDADPTVVGTSFTAAVVELGLASYPGFSLTAPPSAATPYGVYRPGYADRGEVEHVVVHADGRAVSVPEPGELAGDQPEVAVEDPVGAAVDGVGGEDEPAEPAARGTVRVPLGQVAHARSGDKGGDANIGVWPRESAQHPGRAAWLRDLLTPDRVRALLPEARGLDVSVHPLPNLEAVNVVLHGLLGQGVAASGRFDPQAKGLGEWLRARYVDVPEELL